MMNLNMIHHEVVHDVICGNDAIRGNDDMVLQELDNMIHHEVVHDGVIRDNDAIRNNDDVVLQELDNMIHHEVVHDDDDAIHDDDDAIYDDDDAIHDALVQLSIDDVTLPGYNPMDILLEHSHQN